MAIDGYWCFMMAGNGEWLVGDFNQLLFNIWISQLGKKQSQQYGKRKHVPSRQKEFLFLRFYSTRSQLYLLKALVLEIWISTSFIVIPFFRIIAEIFEVEQLDCFILLPQQLALSHEKWTCWTLEKNIYPTGALHPYWWMHQWPCQEPELKVPTV